MKPRILLLALVSFTLAAPAFAGTVYNDGPINGTSDGWTINFGFTVSDSFTVSSSPSTLTALTFGAWLIPGDTLETAEVSITSMPDGGTSYFDQTVSFSGSGCNTNQYGFDVCSETGDFHGPNLGVGVYWLNLQNATTDTINDPVYWDENDGVGCTSPGCPSTAWCDQCIRTSGGNIGPESFTLYGNTSSGTVPEPSSILLLGSGILGVVGIVRRRMR